MKTEEKIVYSLTENNGTVYPIPNTLNYYVLPRTEFLLHKVKGIEEKLIKWYKDHKYSQGDSYDCFITNKGKWGVSHSNDYPMQHGDGHSYIFSEEDFKQALLVKEEDK